MAYLIPKDAAPTEKTAQKPLAEAIKMLPEDTKIVGRYQTPDIQRLASADYTEKIFMGKELRKGETLIYELPAEIQQHSLDAITILHRKERKYAGSIKYNVPDANGVMRKVSDTEGAYTRVLVFDGNTGKWVCWRDPYKRPDDVHYGMKFAEKRPPNAPEVETLYDWAKQGDIRPLYIAVTATGVGPRAVTNFHGLEVQVFPKETDESFQETIFSPGTRFVNRKNGTLEPTYGGGEHHGNQYPDSKALGGGYGSDGSLQVDIDHEYEFSRLEVAAGDTHASGTLGWAKLYAQIVWHDAGGQEHTDTLFENQNVPPSGVIKGSLGRKIHVKPGDRIFIQSRGDIAYVMGFRTQ